MPHLGPTELIIILVIVLAIFGAGKLGSLGGALGKGVRDFRKSVRDDRPAEGESAKAEPKQTQDGDGTDA